MSENKPETLTELNNLNGERFGMVGWNPDNPKSIDIYCFDDGEFERKNLDTPRKVAKALLEFRNWNWDGGYLSFSLNFSSSIDDYNGSKYNELRADLDLDNWQPTSLIEEGFALYEKITR